MRNERLTILAIDDNQDNLTSIVAVVSDAIPGIRVLTALDGQKGLELARAEDPDVILLDIVMPGMDGFAVCRQLKDDERLRLIPVIFLTAMQTDRENRVKALEVGAEGFLAKPLDEQELTAQILAMAKIKAANQTRLTENERLSELVAQRTRELEKELVEHRQAEEAIRQARDDWESTFNTVTDIVTLHDLDFNIVLANNAAQDTLGQSLGGELIGAKCFKRYHGTDSPPTGCPSCSCLQTKTSKTFELYEPHLNRHLEIRAIPRLDDSNRLVGMLHVVRDITERKRAEEALRLSDAKFRMLAENSPMSISVSSGASGMFEYINPKAVELFGYTAGDMPTVDEWYVRVYPDEEYRKSLVDEWKRRTALAIGSKSAMEPMASIVTCKDGSKKSIEWGLVPIGDRNIIYGLDLTKRKQAEAELLRTMKRAEAASKAKSEFLATVSHEIRTPLNAVIGFSEVLLETPLGDDQREMLQIIKARGMDLATIINDILDLAKIEAEQLDLSACEFSLRRIVGEAVETFTTMTKIKSLGLACRISNDIPDAWIGDPLRIKQVLVNLLGNAIKFTEKGGITVTVAREAGNGKWQMANGQTTDNQQLTTDHLLFTVADTGIGIPADKLDLIFHAFTQADGSHTRKYGGTGLGLTICERLCGLMGGRVWAESEPGKGSVFHFTVALSAITAPSSPVPANAHEETRKSPGIRVLAIDDDPASAQVALRHIHNFGGTTTIASTGEEGLAIVEKRHDDFDLVLMDVRMPGMSGLDATQKVRTLERERGLPRLMIVAMTANAMDEDRDACLAVGMDAHLPKPIRKDALFAVLSTAASKHT